LKTRNSTLEVLIQAILNYPEEEVPALVTAIRTCESLDTVAESILAKEAGVKLEDEDAELDIEEELESKPPFEKQLSVKMGELRLGDGFTRYIGGTSHLIFAGHGADEDADDMTLMDSMDEIPHDDPITSWTTVTTEPDLVTHLLNMYFTWSVN
jgi:hypothetical protein